MRGSTGDEIRRRRGPSLRRISAFHARPERNEDETRRKTEKVIDNGTGHWQRYVVAESTSACMSTGKENERSSDSAVKLQGGVVPRHPVRSTEPWGTKNVLRANVAESVNDDSERRRGYKCTPMENAPEAVQGRAGQSLLPESCPRVLVGDVIDRVGCRPPIGLDWEAYDVRRQTRTKSFVAVAYFKRSRALEELHYRTSIKKHRIARDLSQSAAGAPVIGLSVSCALLAVSGLTLRPDPENFA
ncbi:hypothetical protein R3P38DRAFT_3342147 [Favolaschia claudopus]|uniref:Uncharacterized protein n=1 Tax=Favolaschia claudopus TaxID=2862362 RepID=A0AAW0E2V9_9AGAR